MGTLAAQLIPIVGMLVLARIFAPESFGVFSVWLGAVLFLGVILTCRFETSLAVEADGHARPTAVLMILVTIVMLSAVAMFVVWLAAATELQALKRLPVELLVALVPSAALVAATQTLQSWAAADGRYRHLTVIRIAQATSIVLLQIAMGLTSADAVGLGIGYVAGVCVGFAVGVFHMPLKKLKARRIMSVLFGYWRRHRRFPTFALPADAVNAATAQVPVLIVAARFGAEAAGLVAMALRMLGAPMSLLAASVLDVFKRHAGQAYRERGECRAEYLYALRILLVIAAMSGLAIGFGAEPFFALAFGEVWLGAGTIALCLLPRFVVGFVASPLSYMVYIADKQHLDLIWQIALLVMTLVTLLFVDSLHSALVLYGSGYSGLYLIYLFMSYRFSLGSRQ